MTKPANATIDDVNRQYNLLVEAIREDVFFDDEGALGDVEETLEFPDGCRENTLDIIRILARRTELRRRTIAYLAEYERMCEAVE